VDWIERWTGFSPDNGDGSFEFLIMVAAAAALICVIMLWRLPGVYDALRRLLPLLPDRRRIYRRS
jgi:hypothetical protein